MPQRGGRKRGHVPIQPRGGGRGHHSGSARGGRSTANGDAGDDAAQTGHGGGSRPRDGNAAHFLGRPPGLRGRDIGLWHAQRSQANTTAMKDPKYYLALNIGIDQEAQLISSINDIRDELRRLQMPERPTECSSENSNQTRVHASNRPPATDSGSLSTFSMPSTSLSRSTSTAAPAGMRAGPSSANKYDESDDEVVELCDEEELVENGTLDASSALAAGGTATSDAAFRALLHMDAPQTNSAGIRSTPTGIFSEAFDSELRAAYARKMEKPSSTFMKMLQYRRTLPVYQQRQHILASIKNSPVVVISGETGCGKTTQVPQFLLDDYLSQAPAPAATFVKPFRIMVTQPRRISAISVADRVAVERDEMPGTSVGFIVRLENTLPRSHASITYCTTGILLQWLKSDTKLSGITHVILDEIHEQDISSDFLMIILKKLLAGERRNDLKVILMSATLNSEKFSSYFNDAPLIHVPGFTFPVQQHFVEDVMKMFLDSPGGGARLNTIEQQMSTVRVPAFRRKYTHGSKGDSNREEEQQFVNFVKHVVKPQYGTRVANMMERLRQNEGKVNFAIVEELVAHLMQTTPHTESILIFVPGWSEIHKLHQTFSQKYGRSHVIIPLHSMLPTSQQRTVFERTPPGQRKLVIASSIAETSITIDDIVHVIDSGLARMSDFDPETNVQLLDTVFETKANLTQRKGRAGRVKAGCSYHLVSRCRFEFMQDYQKPELLRSRLENVCLQVKILEYENVRDFLAQAVQPPPPATVESAIQMLKDINAFERNSGALTPLGRHLAHLPMDPLLGRTLLYAAIFSCLEPVANICACLGYKDPFVVPFNSENFAREKKEEFARQTASDHLACHYALQEFERNKIESRNSDDRGRGLRDWCWENYISKETANLLLGMRNQFGSYLKALHFISNSNIKDSRFNRNSENALLIVSVVALGLYPNWGCVPHTFGAASVKKHAQELFQLEVGFLGEKNKGKKKVKVHANSVVNRLLYVDRGYMAFSFARRMDQSYFVYDASFITSPMLLALACDELLTKREKDFFTLIADDWVHLKSNDRSYKCMVHARQAFSSLLLRAYASPAEYMPRLHGSGISVENKFLAGLWRAVADELDLSAGESPVQVAGPSGY